MIGATGSRGFNVLARRFGLVAGTVLIVGGLGLGLLVYSRAPGRGFVTAALAARPPLLLAVTAFLFWCTTVGLILALAHRATEASQRKRDQIVHAALSNLTEGVVVAGPDGRFLLFNEAAERVLGMGRLDLQPSEWSTGYGCFRDEGLTPFPPGELPLTRALQGLVSSEVEVFIRNANLPDGIWISINGAPLPRGESDRGGGVVTFRDVSARKLAELALRQSLEQRQQQEELVQRLYNAVEQTADSVFITNRDGVIEYLNRAFETTTGYSREEALGKTPRLLKSGHYGPEHYRDLWQTILSGRVYRSTNVNLRKNGQEYYAEQTITPMTDARGFPTHFVSVVKDVTERIAQQKRQFEMECAASVQRGLYPQRAPHVEAFDIAGAVFPAAATGGDYFDYVLMQDGCLALAIGDVCGHGLASALIMTETRAYVRSLASTHSDPGEILTRVNAFLLEHLEDERQYVTLLLVRLDLVRQRLTYASAGHTDGFVLRADGQSRIVLPSTGVPLGMFAWASYASHDDVDLRPGDFVVLLTDGMTEAERPDGQLITTESLLDAIASVRDRPAQAIVQHARDFVSTFTGHRPPPDDLTIVIAKVQPLSALA